MATMQLLRIIDVDEGETLGFVVTSPSTKADIVQGKVAANEATGDLTVVSEGEVEVGESDGAALDIILRRWGR